MANIPAQYAWLTREGAPQLLVQALGLYGVTEIPGPKSNPTILSWAKNLGSWFPSFYKDDDIPWCGLFMAEVCRRAGLPVVKEPLRALAWAQWGTPQSVAMLGDILVFQREGGGHVGIYVAEDDTCYYVLGGNQGNQVNITRILKSRIVAIRRTAWKVAQPRNVRQVKVTVDWTGYAKVSENEA